MSDLLVVVLFLIAGILVIAVVAAFRRVPFKAGLKAGEHEISIELNGRSHDQLALDAPATKKK